MAQPIVTFNIGYDMHKLNASHLTAAAIKAEIAGFHNDLHMKGATGYASLFYNLDARTMEAHTEFDMNMTTIYVQKQEWNKRMNHLMFQFHLTGNDDGLLSIPMNPGTVLYYHGYLLTHQQIHDKGKCTTVGCCLNYSGYANCHLLSHFIKSFQQYVEKKEEEENDSK